MASVFALNKAAGRAPTGELGLTDIDLCAWMAQAGPGDVLEYHCGALSIDRNPVITTLGRDEAQRIDRLADAAFRAAEVELIDLLQRRLGQDCFSYLAVARSKLRTDRVLATNLLAELPERGDAACPRDRAAA